MTHERKGCVPAHNLTSLQNIENIQVSVCNKFQ